MVKNKNTNVDSLLRSALDRTEAPDPELVQRVKNTIYREEASLKKPAFRRSFSAAAAVCTALVLLATSAFAAWYFLNPSDIAGRFGDTALSAAFEGESAVNINQSVTSGDYTFTLLATVSGRDLTDRPAYSNGVILSGRTYAVLAIQKADGSPMPSPMDDEYGSLDFYASPYVKGLKPWEVNAHTMNGGHTEAVLDGVLYRIIACDEVSMFADRGVYLGVSTGSFYSSQAYVYNEQTGELKANPDYAGSCVLFDLPLDKSLADPVKAQEYLDTMWDNEDTPSANTGDTAADENPSLTVTLTEDAVLSE